MNILTKTHNNQKTVTKKTIIKTIGIIAIVASVLTNAYFISSVSWKRIKQGIYMQGVNNAVGSILSQVQNQGRVIINLENGQRIILVPEIGN